MSKLRIEYIPIEELKTYENNAKVHTAEQIEQIKKSIAEFGMNDPIAVWKDNVIIEGHGRLEACKKLGMEEVPIIRLDDLTDEQRKAYMNIHNQLTMNTGFNFEILTKELESIESIDMSQFGFDTSSMQEEQQQDVIEDDYVEDVPETPRTKLGYIYILGDHRLICGDSTDASVIDKLMDGEKKFDCIFTDMPYGMNLNTDYSSMVNRLEFAEGKNIKNGKKYEQGIVDDFTPEMIDAVFSIESDEMFLFGADYFCEYLPNKNDGSWIVWDKRANGNDDINEDYSSDKMYGSCFELCWSKKKHKRDIARVKWAGVFGTEQEFDHKRHHPTQKPIKLVSWFLDKYTIKGQSVVDLFGGSGSTMIACEQLGRKCYMAELDEHYCDVIVDRWEKFTGKKAILING